MDNILTIDIGNTNAKYAVFDGNNIVEKDYFNPVSDDLAKLLEKYDNIKKCILASVGGHVEECMNQLQSIKITVLSSKTRLPFSLNYKEKDKVGSDRLAAVAAGYSQKPHENSLIIDIGSCITYDILTADSRHEGGPISPGVRLRFMAMHDHTALLPLLSPDNKYITLKCQSTNECLQSGVLLGIQYEIEGFIKNYSHIYNDLNVFVIGGDNKFFEDKLKNCIFANSNFILNGLRFILDYNENQ